MTKFLLGLYGLALTLQSAAAFAEPIKIGLMGPAPPPALASVGDGLAAALAQRGLARDRDFTFALRSADGKVERLPTLARELVDAHVAVIVTSSYPAVRAAEDATSTIPIVSINAGEPVETGLAATLAHPGGNVTGLSDMSSELSAKRLELLRLAVPGMKRVAMLWNTEDLGMSGRYKAASAGATTMGIAVQALGVREPDDFTVAFDAMNREKPDGILMVTDILTILNRKRVFEFAAAHHLPAIYEFDNLARDGGLMSYGADGKEVLARVSDLVARILKGAKPADLPFEQPTRFVFVVNRKTADSEGITLPASLLERADEVIE
ncbi:MAG TPA: ABC transporter substrate-binding protein [Stellaceae bacterium]|nr:ABC transporter substrate-binding protein [Stellaceae bacterium]